MVFLKTVQVTSTDADAPNTVISIIYGFYPWVLEVFEVYNEKDFVLENDKTLITLTNGNVDRTAYGRINIAPENKDIHLWKFKVITPGQIAFGIDESECKEAHIF
eukprot:106584_1